MSLIRVNRLSWRYAPLADGGYPVIGLDDVSLDVEAGSFTGVVGATGAGKSTLLMALAGIIPNLADGTMAGMVEIGGENTRDVSVARLSRRVGYVQQDPESQLFCASVEEEVAFPLEQRGMDPRTMDRRVDEVLAMVGMQGMRARVPSSLSGGQMQRVAIAAALAPDPDVLVLDEPTAALDPDGKREVFDVLGRIRRDRTLTVVMAEQDTRHLARWADRIVLLDRGRVVRDGDADLFSREPRLLESLGVMVPGEPPALKVREDGEHDRIDGDEAIVVDHPTHRYGGATSPTPPALDDVTVAIPRGAFVGLIGRNGSGKTTLARHLNALLAPTSGRVVVDGLDTRSHAVGKLAAHVGYCFQNPDHQIFCSSTREEIAFGAKALGRSGRQVDEVVDRMMDDFGLTGYADVSPATLGYGDRRSVALASVLAMQTPILVLDEPTAGLDTRRSARLLGIVSRLNATGITVVMISHDMAAVARYCSHVLELDHGRVARFGKLVN